jgi:hypothetical protein
MSAILPFLIWGLTASAWMSAVILVRAAFVCPRVGALTERAVVAVVLAIFGSVYSLAVLNSEWAHLVDGGDVVSLLRIAVVVLLLLPVWWSFMYLTNRLGPGGDR